MENTTTTELLLTYAVLDIAINKRSSAVASHAVPPDTAIDPFIDEAIATLHRWRPHVIKVCSTRCRDEDQPA